MILIPIHFNGSHLRSQVPVSLSGREGGTLVKITLCSRTENKMSWLTKHLHSQNKQKSHVSIDLTWSLVARTFSRSQVSVLTWTPGRPKAWGREAGRPHSGHSPGLSLWSSQLRYLSRKWRCLVCHDILFSVSLHNAIFTGATKLSDKLWEHLSQLDSEKTQCTLSFIYLFISLYSMFSMTE